jgi:hypothetical protein
MDRQGASEMSVFDSGPYLTAAFCCERVLTEVDGVNSYVRVVDRVARQVIGPEPPQGLPPYAVHLVLVLQLKAGEARGTFPLWLEIERPSGQRGPTQAQTLHFSGGPQNGVNLHVGMNLAFDQQGIWWIDVLGGDQRVLMTRVPLEFQDLWVMGPQVQGPSSPP